MFLNGDKFILWRRKWQPTPVLLLRKFHGWRSLVGYSPWDCKESYTTERLHFTSCDLTQMCLLVYYQIFLVECLWFPPYRTESSVNKDNIYLPFQYACLSFLFLPAALATMFCAILNRSNDSNSRFWFFFPSGLFLLLQFLNIPIFILVWLPRGHPFACIV